MSGSQKVNSGVVKKILIWLLLLIVFLSLYTWWKLHRTERGIERVFLTALAPTDSTAGAFVQRVDISPWNGHIRFQQPAYFSKKDTLQASFQSATIFIGRWASIQMAVLPAQFVLNRLDHTKLTFTQMENNFGESVISEIDIDLFGNPLQLYPILVTGEFPTTSLRMVVRADSISASYFTQNYPQFGRFLPDVETKVNAKAEVLIDPLRGVIELVELLFEESITEVTLTGLLEFDQIESIREPVKIETLLEITNNATNIINPLTEIALDGWGRLNFKKANWQFNATINDSISDFSKLPLIEESNFIHLNNINLYPNVGQLGQIGQVLILFGVPIDRFHFLESNISFIRPDSSVIHISSAELLHSNFKLSFNGRLNPVSGKIDDKTAISGSIRVGNLSEALQNVSANAEFLLGMSLRRERGDIIFNVSGTLGSPQFR
jgi:hypothetical protein